MSECFARSAEVLRVERWRVPKERHQKCCFNNHAGVYIHIYMHVHICIYVCARMCTNTRVPRLAKIGLYSS